ncbi:MAG: nitroreductase [Clostridia bacterium]|nr:nitroreductase [Clostridia bacterium]
MSYSVKEIIKQRRSVRTFDERPLSEEDMNALREYISATDTPFSVPVTFGLLGAKEYGLSSPVIVGANTYLAAKAERLPNHELALGYAFEKACIYAWSKGIGTVMLAASLNRAAFERAMDVGEGEVMPMASPVGYPAKRMSVRESVMRKGLKADRRLPFDKLFFDGSFERGLKEENAGVFASALEAVRWAPSAGNRQPWRVVTDGERAHFYKAGSLPKSALGDIQKVDIGIALMHFEAALSEEGISGRFEFSDAAPAAPEGVSYTVTFVRE